MDSANLSENNTEVDHNLYDVIFFWDNTRDDREYKQYCSETLCNVLEYSPQLAVKLIYEAADRGKCLILSTRNIEKATNIRNTLLALEMQCHISPNEVKQMVDRKKEKSG